MKEATSAWGGLLF
jgi:hypothetical protein